MAKSPHKQVLILDDDVDVCRILKLKLETAGFEIFSAQTIEEGFTAVEKNKPDCILLDIRFQQGQDGLTFLRRLRAFRSENPDLEDRIRKIPVIVLTSAAETIRSLFELEGISGFIEKPFDTNEVQEKIESLLQS